MILLGASGHGKVIANILTLSGNNDIQFWDDNANAYIQGYTISKPKSSATEELIISIGNNAIRKKIAESSNFTFGQAFHPSAIIASDVNMDKGTVVMAGAIINPGSTIGEHCIINTGAIVDHDAQISSFVHISPKATLAGNVTVEEGSWIGAGATIIQGVRIGKWAIVGAGAVVIRDVPDFAVVVGNPSRIIKYNQPV